MLKAINTGKGQRLPPPPGIDILVYGFVFFLIALTLPFNDPDFYWHIKTGEVIAATRSLPSSDIFSFTMAGQPWTLHEWLSQLVLYWVDSAFGLPGLRILTALMFVPAFFLVNRLAYSLNGNLFRVTMITGTLMVLSFPSCSPRPQLFTFLFFAIYVYALFRLKYMDDRGKLILLPPIMVLWANAHGGYIIGLVIIGIIWSTELVSTFMSRHDGTRQKGHLRVLTVTLAATALASLLTPYGFHLWLYPFEVMGMDASKEIITEWQSPDFHDLHYQIYLAVILAYGAVLIYSHRKPDLTEAALSFAFIFVSFTATRNIPLTALVLAPLFGLFLRYIPGFSKALSGQENTQGTEISSAAEAPGQSNTGGWVFFVFCLLLAGFVSVNAAKEDPVAKLNETLPVTTVAFIKQNGITGNMFNHYNYGGYLVHEFYPQQKIFIDGRADMYGDDFIWEYMNINNGAPKWKQLFDKHEIDYAILDEAAPITQLLTQSGEFSLVHKDRSHVLLLRNDDRYKPIISRFTH